MSSGKKDFTGKTPFEAEMEQVDKPTTDLVTSTLSTEDIPEVSIDTKKVSQNQVRGKANTYAPASH